MHSLGCALISILMLNGLNFEKRGRILDSLKRYAERCYHQSLEQILRTNGKYMSESNKHRIFNGADIMVMRHDQESRGTGFYQCNNGRSVITVCAIDPQQIEMSTIHETNHFASKHDEIKIPNKNGSSLGCVV